MSKAERRKRARQRAKDRVAAVPASERLDGPVHLDPTTAVVEPSGVEEDTSGYITGPIVPPVRREAAPAVRRVPVTVVTQPGDDQVDDEGEDEDEDDRVDGADEDEDDGDEDDGDDGDDDEDDEDEDTPEDEAVFQAACAAIEQGDELSWNELITNLCAAEIDDPRLGLLVALLVEGVEGPQRLTGDRVLSVLSEIGLGDLVEEAREVATFSPDGEGDSPEDRAIVRENARELDTQAKRELATQGGVKVGKAPKGGGRPLRASDIRAHKTALSSPGLLGAAVGRAGQKS